MRFDLGMITTTQLILQGKIEIFKQEAKNIHNNLFRGANLNVNHPFNINSALKP
jgi:hypothetical protein